MPETAFTQNQQTTADYPYVGTYVNMLPDIIHPDIEYINTEMVVQDAVISAVQPVSFNEVGQSFYRYSTEDTQRRSWAQAMYKSYTFVDWRQFLSTNLVGDATYVFGTGSIKKGVGDTGSYSSLTADGEVKRAFEVLKNKAYVPENVSMDNYQIWNSISSIHDTVPRTYAIMSMYMAMGKEFFLPPLICHDNLDGQWLPDNGIEASIKDMTKTSLFSLPDASRFSYYSVHIRDAMHYIYQAPTLVEGYLWSALQDGIISVDELTENGRIHLSNFASGKYAQPISTFNAEKLGIPPLTEQMQEGKSYLLGQRIGITDAESTNEGAVNRLVLRTVVNPNAMKNENMTLIDFCVYLAQVMHLQGEPVLTAAEQQMLVAAYGNRLPVTMSEDYYKTILYLVARGIVSDDIPVASFYDKLTYRDMYVLLSRVADPASRLTFKYVTVPYDLSMAEEGFMPLIPSVSNLSVTDVEIKIANRNYYDILVEKDGNTLFLNRSGKEEKPYISRQQDYGDPAYGKVLTSAVSNEQFYHFRIYTDFPRPAVSNRVHKVAEKNYYRYYLYADNSDKKLILQFEEEMNAAPGGVYIYDARLQMLVKDSIQTASVLPRYAVNGLQESPPRRTADNRVSRVFGDDIVAYLTSSADERVMTDVEVTFKLRRNVDLTKLTIAGTTYNDWKNNSDSPVRLLSEDETGYVLNMTVETATPDDVMAIIASQIETQRPLSDSVAYVRRASINDIYYSIGFLEKELGCNLLEFGNETYVLSFPAEKILINKTDAGWLAYGTNSIIRFMSNIPAVKKRVNTNNQVIDNSFDNYLVHAYVVEHYMRANYKNGWSTFIGTDGVLHIYSSATNNRSESDVTGLTIEKEDFTADLKIIPNSKIYNLLSPTLTDMSDSFMPLYEDVSTGERYLDLRAIPPNLTNAITMWNISGTGQITAGVISLVPNHTFKSSNDPTTLQNAISRSDITIGQRASFNYRYMQASHWGTNLPNYGTAQTVTNGWILTEYLRYDPETFTLLYKLPETNDIKKILSDDAGFWRLPYAYDNRLKQVAFVNLPFLKAGNGELRFVKSDIEVAILDTDISELAKMILEAAADDEDFGERQWFPVAPLSELFIKEANQPWLQGDLFGLKSFGYAVFENIFRLTGNWNKIYVVGPYQLTEISGGNAQRLKFNLNRTMDGQGLPTWANLIYGDLKTDISKESPVYVLEFDSKTIILPALNSLSPDERSKKSTNLAGRIVSLDATVSNGLKDFLSSIFENEKMLSRRLEDAEGIISIIYLFVIVVIPRFLILSLFLIELLALVSGYRPVIWFAKRVFDPFKLASFGRTNIDEIRPLRFFICCSLGMVFIILVSREYATHLVSKALESVLVFFRF